jgi:hypothetical protein
VTDLAAARIFVHTNGRVLDRRLFARVFEDGRADGVVDAVRAYRNEDGGLGHGLEPDKRVPSSQPLDTETGFEALDLGDAVDRSLVVAACDWLASVADASGLVPLVFDDMPGFPHAEHWDQIPRVPGLNPTAGLAALLWKWGVDHPWRDEATAGCWKAIEDEVPGEAHALAEALRFLEHVPDRGRVEALEPRIRDRLPEVAMLLLRPGSGEYGVTPLHIAPWPDSYWRRLFAPAVIEGFLAELEAAQQADGGWPIAWEPPGPAAVYEWRAWVTIRSLMVLRAAGRLSG